MNVLAIRPQAEIPTPEREAASAAAPSGEEAAFGTLLAPLLQQNPLSSVAPEEGVIPAEGSSAPEEGQQDLTTQGLGVEAAVPLPTYPGLRPALASAEPVTPDAPLPAPATAAPAEAAVVPAAVTDEMPRTPLPVEAVVAPAATATLQPGAAAVPVAENVSPAPAVAGPVQSTQARVASDPASPPQASHPQVPPPQRQPTQTAPHAADAPRLIEGSPTPVAASAPASEPIETALPRLPGLPDVEAALEQAPEPTPERQPAYLEAAPRDRQVETLPNPSQARRPVEHTPAAPNAPVQNAVLEQDTAPVAAPGQRTSAAELEQSPPAEASPLTPAAPDVAEKAPAVPLAAHGEEATDQETADQQNTGDEGAEEKRQHPGRRETASEPVGPRRESMGVASVAPLASGGSGTNVPVTGKDVRPSPPEADVEKAQVAGGEGPALEASEPTAFSVAEPSGIRLPGESEPPPSAPAPPASHDETTAAPNRAETARKPVSAALMDRWQADLQGLVTELHTEVGGWQRLRLRLDDDGGTVTLRARREDDRVAVTVAFSDPALRQVAQASAERLHTALETQLGQQVAFSFDGGGSDAQQHASTGDRRTASPAPSSAHAPESDRTATLPRRTADGNREWIG